MTDEQKENKLQKQRSGDLAHQHIEEMKEAVSCPRPSMITAWRCCHDNSGKTTRALINCRGTQTRDNEGEDATCKLWWHSCELQREAKCYRVNKNHMQQYVINRSTDFTVLADPLWD